MSTVRIRSFIAMSLGAALLMACPSAAQDGSHGHGSHGHGSHGDGSAPPATPAFKGDPYLLDTDPVSGAKLGEIAKQVVIDHDGRELRFESDANAKAFLAEPAKYLPAVDAALVKQQLPYYPLETCPVSGDKLGGDMGAPVDVIVKNRLVRLCCADCKDALHKDPEKLFAKLDAAVIAKQGNPYAAKNCVVSDEAFGGEMGEPVDVVIGNRLVRLCCAGCKKKLRKDPLKFLAKLGDQK